MGKSGTYKIIRRLGHKWKFVPDKRMGFLKQWTKAFMLRKNKEFHSSLI
jgi:hypothetical protein